MRTLQTTITLLAATLALGGCSEEYFDKATYNDRIEGSFPVKNLDPQHDWAAVAQTRLGLTMDAGGTGDVYVIKVYDTDPRRTATANLLGAYAAPDGERFNATVSHQAGLRYLWFVMIPQAGGQAYIDSHTIDNGGINTTLKRTQTYYGSVQETTLTLRYMFETSFPAPDDFDYNDIVLDINCMPVGTRQVRLNVSLAAIGDEKQTAAGLRFDGIPASAIESIEIEGDSTWFDRDDKPTVSLDFISPDPRGLIAGAPANNAVLYLYNDSHWALLGQKGPYGDIVRPYTNTVRGMEYVEQGIYGIIHQPRKCTALITFTEEKYSRIFGSATLDPFVIVEYNGSRMEVHTYPYRSIAAVFNYDRSGYDTKVPWALLVPGDTKYPLEGVCIGSGQPGALGGAYNIYGHAFAQWAMDHTQAKDWWQYPARGSVY